MRKFLAIFVALALVFSLGANTAVMAAPSSSLITTTATGYDSADDVVYKTYSVSGRTVISNWGARGETCVFLTTYAEEFYEGQSDWDILSKVSGGTTYTNAHFSQLYSQLQALMVENHTYYTYYDDSQSVRLFYKYTDCVSNNTSKVSLLYRGGLVTSSWNGGSIWNQEHVWPKSKFANENDIRGDIMLLRPANPSENTSRSNKAFGKTTNSSYYFPGDSVKGDCARMILYCYVRWGTYNTMWGSGGVMEGLSILLQWMEEDPVDTWEMARNDSVQSITGTRNVFVDYPEYAWLLFGKDVPTDMVTPSGEAANMTSSTTPPVQDPPVQNPPVTEPPVSEPPATEPPVTEPPVTNPPATEPSVDGPSTTEPPVTAPDVMPTDPSGLPNDDAENNSQFGKTLIIIGIAIASLAIVVGGTVIILATIKRKKHP